MSKEKIELILAATFFGLFGGMINAMAAELCGLPFAAIMAIIVIIIEFSTSREYHLIGLISHLSAALTFWAIATMQGHPFGEIFEYWVEGTLAININPAYWWYVPYGALALRIAIEPILFLFWKKR